MTPEQIRKIRQDLSRSQSEFAVEFGIPLKTLQNWEQGCREPDAAAITLLKVIEFCPDAVRDTVAEM